MESLGEGATAVLRPVYARLQVWAPIPWAGLTLRLAR